MLEQNVINVADYSNNVCIFYSSGGRKSLIKVLADSLSGEGLCGSSETVSFLTFSE